MPGSGSVEALGGFDVERHAAARRGRIRALRYESHGAA
jgi:hypothetical protein